MGPVFKIERKNYNCRIGSCELEADFSVKQLKEIYKCLWLKGSDMGGVHLDIRAKEGKRQEPDFWFMPTCSHEHLNFCLLLLSVHIHSKGQSSSLWPPPCAGSPTGSASS